MCSVGEGGGGRGGRVSGCGRRDTRSREGGRVVKGKKGG